MNEYKGLWNLILGTMSDSEKQSLLLARRQRDFLQGDLEVSDDHRRSIKSKIRDRIEGSLEDFELLDGMAQDDTLQERIGNPESLVPLLKFVFLAVDLNRELFEDMIAEAVIQGLFVAPSESTQTAVNADVEITIETEYDPKAILEKYQSGEDLTPEEIGVLVTAAGSEGLDLEKLSHQSTADSLRRKIIDVGSHP